MKHEPDLFMILRRAGEGRLQPGKGSGCSFGVDRRAGVSKALSMIFVRKKDRIHGDDAHPRDGPGPDGEAAESLPIGGQLAMRPGEISGRSGGIFQEWPAALDIVVPTFIVVVARGQQDLRLVVSLPQLGGDKGNRPGYKSTIVLRLGVMRCPGVGLGKSVG